MIIIFLLNCLFAQVVTPITEQNDTSIQSTGDDFMSLAQEEIVDKFNLKSINHSLRINAITSDSKRNSSVKASFVDNGSALSIKLRQMANVELGVAFLQDIFNSLPYDTFTTDEDTILIKMVDALDAKLKLYTNIVNKMINIVDDSYRAFVERRKQKKRKLVTENLVLDFGHGGHGLNEQHQDYYPCCLIPDHYLIFDPHFGTRVNTELWCDSGLEHERFNAKSELFFTPIKLTELFSMNHHEYPNLKWQFFISASGVHTEFPAHRPGSGIGSDCGQSSRHHQIYENTVRDKGRNIVLLFDVGISLEAGHLLTANGIGHYILDTLTEKDKIAVSATADSYYLPMHECMTKKLMPATHDIKEAIRQFISHLEMRHVPTNHSLGFIKVLDLIDHWSTVNKAINAHATDVLLIYVTKSLLTDLKGVADIMKILGNRIDTIDVNIVISIFNLDFISDYKGDDVLKFESLNHLVSQNYEHYGLSVLKTSRKGEIINLPITLRVAPVIKNFYDVVQQPMATKSKDNYNVTISDVYWDQQGEGMVVTFSKALYDTSGDVVGIVGIDISLAYLLEDATYFTSADGGYIIITDAEGNVLGHPKIGRPELLTSPLMKTPVTLLEDPAYFVDFAPLMLLLDSGHKSTSGVGDKDVREYWWRKCDSFGWIFIISRNFKSHFEQKLSTVSQPLPSGALFHRLDLLSPQEARVCRHFNQMATLDGASVFLSPGAYISPLTYFAKIYHNLNVDVNEMAHLKGQTTTISPHQSDIMRGTSTSLFNMDPREKVLPKSNLKAGVKAEASALYEMAGQWKDLFNSSKLQKYIIRRYGATISGVMLMYPGTLLDASYDPTTQEWYVKATQRPGQVVVSPPFLDPGGAGYIITVSHTVYQGRSTTKHSPSNPIMAVVAADFTLGYWHKLLADIEPLCANSIFFKDYNNSNEESDIRCFLMDISGYLIAHPSFLDPASLREPGSNIPRHITHQESWLSMSLLGKGLESLKHELKGKQPVLEKIWCGKQWKQSSERYYRINLRVGQVITEHRPSHHGHLKNENMCLQYRLTAVPSSNLILGIINQTCIPPASFCPCSTVDRPCLNCQLMETAGCECPCECMMPSDPCSKSPFTPLTIQHKGDFPSSDNVTTEDKFPPRSCPVSPETPSPLHYGVGMLAQLNECQAMHCDTHASVYSCMGVLDCVWCSLEADASTPLDTPYCTHAYKCYGGIRGGPSPYPPGLSPLPRSEERGSVLPILPVVGGVMVVFVVMVVTIYFYRVYTGGTSTAIYTPSSLQSHTRSSPLYPIDMYPDLENGDHNLLDERIMSAEAAAAMSPYRMNPTYRRPAINTGDASDHGYSTMTPHEESDNLTDLAVSSSLFAHTKTGEERSTSTGGWFEANRNHGVSGGESVELTKLKDIRVCTNHTLQSPLSSPKRNGPNKITVPVTVHMVDTM